MLGAILLDNSCMDIVAEILPEPDYFHIENHRLIYAVMLENYAAGKRSDYVTVLNSLKPAAALTKQPPSPTLCSLLPLFPPFPMFNPMLK